MKLVEKYLYAIGRQLPNRGKEEIITELRSTLLDTIEGSYGSEATEDEISQVLKSFGSPSEVAKEYGKSRFVIHPAVTDLYWLIVKIVFFAMLGAFAIIFVVGLFSGVQEMGSIPFGLLSILTNGVNASLTSMGMITLIFAFISKYMQEKTLTDEWDPKQLDELPSDKEAVSAVGTAGGIVFALIFMILFNLYPDIMNIPTQILRDNGLSLVHTIDMVVFRTYLPVLNTIWVFTIFVDIYTLIRMAKTKSVRVMHIILSCGAIGLFYLMTFDSDLYLGSKGFVGFRALFAFLLIVSIIDVISETIKFFVHE